MVKKKKTLLFSPSFRKNAHGETIEVFIKYDEYAAFLNEMDTLNERIAELKKKKSKSIKK